MTYYKLSCPHGYLKSGSKNLSDIEAHRASLIHENEMKADLVRCGFHSSLKYPMPSRQRQAVIRSHRNHLAMIKDELKHWRSAPVEMREI